LLDRSTNAGYGNGVTLLTVREEIRQSKPFRSDAEEATVGILLTASALERRLAAVVEPEKITGQQYNVLRILRGAHPEPLPTLEIATRMIDQTPGITRLLDRLAAKGLARRERGTDDRRCVYCRITAKGLDLLSRLDAPVAAVGATAFRKISRAERAALIRALDRIRHAVRDAESG
jgi:DNA-binding MarR family transcriptional regulator